MVAGKIAKVYAHSLAEEIGLVVGDKILQVNGQTPQDIIAFSFLFAEEEIELLVAHDDGTEEVIAFDKDTDEELGVEFASAVFDGIRSCANHCAFCFVEQVPPGMRASLSVKDDDYRLSFLYGNFVTLTNVGAKDFARIKAYHLSPLYVSVHATNPQLRASMLGTERGAHLFAQLAQLEAANISYHTQLVLCPGVNDGDELERTLQDLYAHRPFVLSVAAVPVGLTKFHPADGKVRMFTQAEAQAVLRQVAPWQARSRRETGVSFIYLSDEFYLLAGEDVPPADSYDGFPQLDNGIGLVRNFLEEWKQVAPIQAYDKPIHLDLVCGTAIAPVLKTLAQEISQNGLQVRVVAVDNTYYGTMVNVSGLLTGQDIVKSLQNLEGERDGILLPASALRPGEGVFLDDMSLEEVAQQFPHVPIKTALTGREARQALTDWHHYRSRTQGEAVYMWQDNAGYTQLDFH